MTQNKKKDTLKVMEGARHQEVTNNDAIHNFKKKRKKKLAIDEYVDGIRQGNLTLLSRAITLIESSLGEHQKMAREIIEKCLPFSGKSLRIGITGIPGVGKSTFIEALGKIIAEKKKLAVLAIDPSSEHSKGSILGDKTRMEKLAGNANAFIRPSPSAGTLGGVARKTRETIVLCEAAGYEIIFIETVGVGQSETAVHSMVDFFLLLMLAGAGDELQGIKRGIMEMADLIAITKADGDNKENALHAKSQFASAIHLLPQSPSNWLTRILTCSAITSEGLEEIWNTVLEYQNFTQKNGYFEKKRQEQSIYWFHESIKNRLMETFYSNPDITKSLPDLEKQVIDKKTSPFNAANKLFDLYKKNINNSF